MNKLTHLDKHGRPKMVDVSSKQPTERKAVAKCSVRMKKSTLKLIASDKGPKGDALNVAKLAGIMAAKKTGELIPLCHPLNITSAEIDFKLNKVKNIIEIESCVKTTGQTGVEMEALTAAAVAALTIYDMCKAVDKDIIISDIMLVEKRSGKSGIFIRE